MERAKRMNGGQSSTASEAGGEHFTVRVRADGQATGPIPVGAPRAFFGIVAIAFVCLTGFVFAYGVYGEKLTAGVDVACARLFRGWETYGETRQLRCRRGTVAQGDARTL